MDHITFVVVVIGACSLMIGVINKLLSAIIKLLDRLLQIRDLLSKHLGKRKKDTPHHDK